MTKSQLEYDKHDFVMFAFARQPSINIGKHDIYGILDVVTKLNMLVVHLTKFQILSRCEMGKKKKKKRGKFNGVYKDFEKCCQDMLFACGLTFCYDEVKFTMLDAT